MLDKRSCFSLARFVLDKRTCFAKKLCLIGRIVKSAVGKGGKERKDVKERECEGRDGTGRIFEGGEGKRRGWEGREEKLSRRNAR